MKEFEDTIWVVFATFELVEGMPNEILSPEIQRASGYMAVKADTEWDVRKTLESELKDINLKLVETDEFCTVNSVYDVLDFDEHLAYNVERWEEGCDAAWGTIYESYGIAC